MAGGTGGHFPGLIRGSRALIELTGALLHWLGGTGTPDTQHGNRLIPPQVPFEQQVFQLMECVWHWCYCHCTARQLQQSSGGSRRVKPDVVLGLGGYHLQPT
jgi:hypothetical protein